MWVAQHLGAAAEAVHKAEEGFQVWVGQLGAVVKEYG